jgi:hypothetical protein
MDRVQDDIVLQRAAAPARPHGGVAAQQRFRRLRHVIVAAS